MALKKFLFVNSEGFYEEGTVEGIISTRVCDSGLAVGDLVMESTTITDGVDKVTNNSNSRSVIGWVYSKLSATSAEILTKGVITGLSGLTKSGKTYLSTTGTFTDTIPTTNYVHILGHAVDATVIDFDPVNTKIKRS